MAAYQSQIQFVMNKYFSSFDIKSMNKKSLKITLEIADDIIKPDKFADFPIQNCIINLYPFFMKLELRNKKKSIQMCTFRFVESMRHYH